MKRLFFLASFIISLSFGAWTAADFPQAELSNGLIKTTLYLPDAETGYYRSTRFDWAGAIASLEYKGHSYFGQWFARHDPLINDGITGPVEEFTPLGFETAKAGETFVKIGVGALRRLDDESPYKFFSGYQFADKGKWTVQKGTDRVDFTHHLTDESSGYGYVYHKTVRLVKGKPELVLEHRLKNTGRKKIETAVYDHNFLMLDQQPSGTDFKVTFPFTVQAMDDLKGVAETRGKTLVYLRPLEKGESIYSILQGYGSTAADYDIRVENSKTGAGVRIRADKPLSKLAFWSTPTNLSPEPFISLNLEPGQETTWTLTYDFYTTQK